MGPECLSVNATTVLFQLSPVGEVHYTCVLVLMVLLAATIEFQSWNKWLRYFSALHSAHGSTKTHTGLISMCDYAWHVQSGSGDVINLFQQETDAWMSHTNTHHRTRTHSNKYTRHQGKEANVTVSRKQSPQSAAWHFLIIPFSLFTFKS